MKKNGTWERVEQSFPPSVVEACIAKLKARHSNTTPHLPVAGPTECSSSSTGHHYHDERAATSVMQLSEAIPQLVPMLAAPLATSSLSPSPIINVALNITTSTAISCTNHDVAIVDAIALTRLPTKCSTGCPSHNTYLMASSTDGADVSTKFAGSMVPDINTSVIAVDASSLAMATPANCSMSRPGPAIGKVDPVAVPLITRGASVAVTAPSEPLSIQPLQSFAVLELDTPTPTRCSTKCSDDNTSRIVAKFPQLTTSWTAVPVVNTYFDAIMSFAVVSVCADAEDVTTHALFDEVLQHGEVDWKPWPPPWQAWIRCKEQRFQPRPWPSFKRNQKGVRQTQSKLPTRGLYLELSMRSPAAIKCFYVEVRHLFNRWWNQGSSREQWQFHHTDLGGELMNLHMWSLKHLVHQVVHGSLSMVNYMEPTLEDEVLPDTVEILHSVVVECLAHLGCLMIQNGWPRELLQAMQPKPPWLSFAPATLMHVEIGVLERRVHLSVGLVSLKSAWRELFICALTKFLGMSQASRDSLVLHALKTSDISVVLSCVQRRGNFRYGKLDMQLLSFPESDANIVLPEELQLFLLHFPWSIVDKVLVCSRSVRFPDSITCSLKRYEQRLIYLMLSCGFHLDVYKLQSDENQSWYFLCWDQGGYVQSGDVPLVVSLVKAMVLPSYMSQPAMLLVLFTAKEFDEPLELHLQWDPGGWSSGQPGLHMASACGQTAFQGGRNVMALDNPGCLDQDRNNHDRCADFNFHHEHKVIKEFPAVPWDPGGSKLLKFYMTSARGRAEFQGGTIVRTSYCCRVGSWASIIGLGPARESSGAVATNILVLAAMRTSRRITTRAAALFFFPWLSSTTSGSLLRSPFLLVLYPNYQNIYNS